MAQDYLMQIPRELRNLIVTDVLTSQPVLLEVHGDKARIREAPNTLAITEVCRRALLHRKQERTSTKVRVMCSKESLVRDLQHLDHHSPIIGRTNENLRSGLCMIKNVASVEIWIGNLAINHYTRVIEPEEENVHSSTTRCLRSNGYLNADEVVQLLLKTVSACLPALTCSLSCYPIDPRQQPVLEAMRAKAAMGPFPSLVLEQRVKGGFEVTEEVAMYFRKLKAAFGAARAPDKLSTRDCLMALGELHFFERRTLYLLDDLLRMPIR